MDLPYKIRTCLIISLVIFSTLYAPLVTAQNEDKQWRQVDPVKVLIDSTADWGRIMFDDLNGTNTNGIRIQTVVDSGWLVGNGENDVLDVGRKIPWPDTEYEHIITRKGDMVAFFKGIRNFNYTEVFAELVLEVGIDSPQIYIWLMTGGVGTTTFDIVSTTTGGTIWRDVIVGTGETQQLRRVMTPQPFLRAGRAENAVVLVWLSVVIAAIIILNFPLLELLTRYVHKKRRTNLQRQRGKGAVEKE
jgi:hypothetical protein